MNNNFLNTLVLFFTIITATSGTIVWVDTRIDNKNAEIKTELSEQAEFHFVELSIKINESILADLDGHEGLTPAQERDYNLLVAENTRLTKRRHQLLGINQ